jgi:hypothetical protein
MHTIDVFINDRAHWPDEILALVVCVRWAPVQALMSASSVT